MDAERLLVIAGTSLLAPSALLGFVQYRYRHDAGAFARWRVVHAGGTTGAVQLLGLGAVWEHFAPCAGAMALALGLTLATWAFFLGPLARALERPRTSSVFLALGTLAAVPSYAGLPLALLQRG